MTSSEHKASVTASSPNRSMVSGATKTGGRNSYGRVTMRHKGGGHKRRHRAIDFFYNKHDIPAKVESIEYDPNRSAYIALLCYADGERRYIIAPDELEVGTEIVISQNAKQKAGNRMPLSEIPVGTFVHCVEFKPGGGAKLARSAGNSVEVQAKGKKHVTLKLPSTEIRKVPKEAWASIGEVSNPEHRLQTIGKAGRNRWLGKRPQVRGRAMNAVDHPVGGGEGRTGRGTRKQKTKWGRPAGKGQKTRKPKKYSDKLIVKRRTKKKKK